MKIDVPFVMKITIRCVAVILFAVIWSDASDCHAQQRGRFFQRARARNDARYEVIWPQSGRSDPNDRTITPGSPSSITYFKPRPSQTGKPVVTYPKYIGGFHYSHFENIGIPSGDIGLRGNAYHWRPW